MADELLIPFELMELSVRVCKTSRNGDEHRFMQMVRAMLQNLTSQCMMIAVKIYFDDHSCYYSADK